MTGETAARDEEAPRLHPGLADVYRVKLAELRQALNDEALRTEAADALRSIIGGIAYCHRRTSWWASLPEYWLWANATPRLWGPGRLATGITSFGGS